jgi:hypothetical protein
MLTYGETIIFIVFLEWNATKGKEMIGKNSASSTTEDTHLSTTQIFRLNPGELRGVIIYCHPPHLLRTPPNTTPDDYERIQHGSPTVQIKNQSPKHPCPEKNNKLPIQNDDPPISHKPFPLNKPENEQAPQNPSIKHKEKHLWKNNNRHPEKNRVVLQHTLFFTRVFHKHQKTHT